MQFEAKHHRMVRAAVRRYYSLRPSWMDFEDIAQEVYTFLLRYSPDEITQQSDAYFSTAVRRAAWYVIAKERRLNTRPTSKSAPFTQAAAKTISLDTILSEEGKEFSDLTPAWLADPRANTETAAAGREIYRRVVGELTPIEAEVLEDLQAGYSVRQLVSRGVSKNLITRVQQKCQALCGGGEVLREVKRERLQVRAKRLLAEGYSTSAIGRTLGVCERTVRVLAGISLNSWDEVKARRAQREEAA